MVFPASWRHPGVSRFLAILPLALLALPPPAAADTALSLDAATRIAAGRAPQLQAQLLREQAARHDAVRAGRLPDPVLTAGVSNLTATGPQAFNAAADAMTTRTLGLMQEIPSHAKRAAERALAASGVQRSAADALALELAVKQATAGAWVRLWAAQTARRELGDLRAPLTLALEYAQARLQGGTGNASDVLAARAAAVELDNRTTAADAETAAAHAALERWLGDAAGSALAAAPDFATLPVAPAQLLRDLDRQGPLLGWDAREDQAQAQLDLAKAGKRPNWSVGLVYGNRIRLPDTVGVEVGVSLPLFSGNRQDQDVSARHAERDAIADEHADARAAQRAAVAASLAAWQGDGRQVASYRDELLPLAADRTRVALAAYRGGGPLQPWLDARRDEAAMRVAYAQALAAWGTAWAQLAYLVPEQDASPASRRPELLP